MGLDTLPFFEKLSQSKRVILAGAGGGHDILCGLPLYFYLREQGKEVTLANLSFSNLYGVVGRELVPNMIEVGPDAGGSTHYFPEKFLSTWFAEQGEDVKVWSFHRTGVVPLAEAYRVLVEELGADTVVLVDGGTDSLMRGDEEQLGTPHEDIASLVAVEGLRSVKQKLLVNVGFGIDAFHGVCHAHYLEAVAALAKVGGYLGTFSLLAEAPEVQRYRQAAQFVLDAMPGHPSIVTSSILSAIEGDYGNVHRTSRTSGSTLWINPLMALSFCFDVTAVVDRCLYADRIKNTRTYRELSLAIEVFRAELPATRPWADIVI